MIDIQPGAGSSNPSGLIVYNNELIFRADDGVNGIEIWTYDGVTVEKLTDKIGQAIPSTGGGNIAILNSKLYFFSLVSGSVDIWQFDAATTTASEASNTNFGQIFSMTKAGSSCGAMMVPQQP